MGAEGCYDLKLANKQMTSVEVLQNEQYQVVSWMLYVMWYVCACVYVCVWLAGWLTD